jgi:hypothetical protein
MRPFKKMLKTLFAGTETKPPENIAGKWSIGIFSGASPVDVSADRAVINPVLSAADVSDVQANFVADPFMIRQASVWYMFFEVDTIRPEGNIGRIGMASSRDGLAWTYQRIVLEASFHLSYPYVFHHDGTYYMIPETRADRAIHLYRAVDFPVTWTHANVLLSGRRFADASIFRYQGRWWLFTDSGNTTLRLYGAPELGGPWKEHPRSPIVKKNLSIARPGGRVVADGDHLIRYAQDCYPRYGNKVWAFRVTELTETTYREEKYPTPVLQPGQMGWNRLGMHTIDAHRIEDGRWLACVDGFGGGGNG